jgi:hypothetical protein
VNVPFYFASTSIWVSYGVMVEDATTMRSQSVSRTYSYTGNADGSAMGWSLSWVMKRVSDDPFTTSSTVRDELSGQSHAAMCVYESEGTYVATENDGARETSRVEGLFFWADAYESDPSQLRDDANSFYPRFMLRDEIGHQTVYRGADPAYTYSSSDGAQIATRRSYPGAASSSHSVRAVSADGLKNAEDILDIPDL